MPKAIIEFDLPEENEEFEIHNKSYDYNCALLDIYNELRQWRKYDNRETVTMEELDKMFFGILDQYDIKI